MSISSPQTWREFFQNYYQKELNKLAGRISSGKNDRSLYVNVSKDLISFRGGSLAKELFENPDKVIDDAREGLALTENIYDVRLENCNPRFFNLPPLRKILIRDLRSTHISKFVSIEGIVRKVTEVRPKIVEAVFVCSNCGRKVRVPQEDSLIQPPFECSCKSKRFVFLPEESVSIDSQRIKIQEYPEYLKGGEQPQSIDVYLEGDITGIVNPGDRVIVNGIVRANPRGQGRRKHIYMDLFIEGNSIEILQQEYEEVEITEEDKKKIIELSESGDIYDKIVRSIAPSIYGYDDIKLAIALQLFGGVPKKLPDGTEIRGDIHILLVGDPGVAKSQLLRYVHRIAPRSVYTTGKGTTTAGLCVAPDTLIFTESYGVEISKLVESTNLNRIGEGIYVSDGSIAVQTINPTKIALKTSNKLWKIKSPEKLVRIKTITGKEIVTTPETKILTIVDGKVCWKQAKDLSEDDFVATARRLEHKGRRILTIELIKDLDNVTVYGVKGLVKDLIEAIKRDRKITTRDLSKLLGTDESNLYYNWVNEDAKGNIKLSTLIKLAELAGFDLEEIAEKIDFFSQFHGHKIKLPKYLDEKFLYFAGLIAGDGDITKTPHGGVTIRFSNTNQNLRDKFRQIVKELFGVEVKEDGNALKFNSKIVGHILNKLGIPNSPKSHRLDMSEILLSLPNKELSAFIRGIFDCDGTVILRNNGSSYVALETTSEKLAKKLQLALLRFGIISHLRKRNTKGQKSMIGGRIVISKHNKFELKIYGDNLKKFAEFIGFEHPEKLKKLQTAVDQRKKANTNIDVIPDVTRTLREIREFYGLNAKDVYGSTTVELRKNI